MHYHNGKTFLPGQMVLVEDRHGPSISSTLYMGWLYRVKNGVVYLHTTREIDAEGRERFGGIATISEDDVVITHLNEYR